MNIQPKSCRPGFTLTELLVVIVIIIVLAVVAFTGLSRFRAMGDRAVSVSILRQLQIANTSYAGDRNGQYVPLVSKNSAGAISMEWYRDPDFLSYLTGQEIQGPSQPEMEIPHSLLDPVVVRAKRRHWQRLSASYGFNSTGLSYPQDHNSPPYCYRVHHIAEPSRTAFIVTATDYTVNYAGRFLWQDAPVEGKTTNSKTAYRHAGKAAVVYYDGSVDFVSPQDMRRFDAAGGRENRFWKAK